MNIVGGIFLCLSWSLYSLREQSVLIYRRCGKAVWLLYLYFFLKKNAFNRSHFGLCFLIGCIL